MPRAGTPEATAAGAERVFAQLIDNLSNWVGVAGCDALFTRALVLSTPNHPVLGHVQLGKFAPYLASLPNGAREYGASATESAVTDVLALVVTMLGDLIGPDMAMTLLDPRDPATNAVAKDESTESQPTHGSGSMSVNGDATQ